MSRVVRSNMASHCASSSQCSADSTTFRTISRFSGSGCEELTRPSRILSMVATLQRQGIGSGRRQPRVGAGEPRGGGELGAQQQRDRPPPRPPQQPHLSGRGPEARTWPPRRARGPSQHQHGGASRTPPRRRQRALRARDCEPVGGGSAPPRPGAGVGVRAPADREMKRALG
uniref:Uncharacterized protein n=1 Tax=Rhinolophus ferrumequinum TaxID=59479 RepID=A0A671F5C4_RHIFE